MEITQIYFGENDFSKTGNTSTIENGREGIANESIDLNSDYLTASTPITDNSDARNMTISFWIKSSNISGSPVLINHLNTLSPSSFFDNSPSALANQSSGFVIRITDQAVESKFLYKDSNNNVIFSSVFTPDLPNSMDDNKWHHIVLRLFVENKQINNSTNVISLFQVLKVGINQRHNRSAPLNLQKSIANSVNPLYKSGAFSIGGLSNFSPSERYDGLIDDLSIYDYALNDANTALLDEPKRSLTVTTTNGTVIAIPNPVSKKYIRGIEVDLTANPDAGFGFVDWTGDVVSSNNTITVAMDSNKSIAANFGATASITDSKKMKVMVYPNPTNDKIKIKTNEDISNIKIFNTNGIEILKVNNSKEVNLQNLSTGIYLLKGQFKNGKISINKIIKK